MRYFGPGDQATGWHIAGMIMWVLFLVAVVLLMVVIVRHLLERPATPQMPPMQPFPPHIGPPRSPALDELELRYARGDIARDDYLTRRADLLTTAGWWPQGPPQAGPPQAGPPQAGPPQAGPPQAGPPRAGPPPAGPPPAGPQPAD